jgi:hypothetical protein
MYVCRSALKLEVQENEMRKVIVCYGTARSRKLGVTLEKKDERKRKRGREGERERERERERNLYIVEYCALLYSGFIASALTSSNIQRASHTVNMKLVVF